MKLFLSLAGAFGFLAVAIGAFGAHGLEKHFAALDVKFEKNFHTATQYHMYHALALIGVALLLRVSPDSKLLIWSGWMFVAGILFFSGSLYAYSISTITKFGMITPIGGLCFLAGWALLVYEAARMAR